MRQTARLLFDDGFGEVAGAVDVDAVFEGHVVGEELEGDHLGDGEEIFRGGMDLDAIGDNRSNLRVTLICYGDYACALGPHVGEELQGFFVAQD